MGKTVKVRIAVAVDRHGRYVAHGPLAKGEHPAGHLATLEHMWRVAPGAICYLVTAELPIPEVREVPGEGEGED